MGQFQEFSSRYLDKYLTKKKLFSRRLAVVSSFHTVMRREIGNNLFQQDNKSNYLKDCAGTEHKKVAGKVDNEQAEQHWGGQNQSGAQTRVNDQDTSCSQSRSKFRPPAGSRSMAAGHISQAAVAPLLALQHDMITMISTLHLAFRKLASKSKSFVSLPVSSAV